MVEDYDIDSGQSAFWESQEGIQAPPPSPELDQAQKKWRKIIGLVAATLLVLFIVVMLPKRPVQQLTKAPLPSPSPTPKALENEWVNAYTQLEVQLKDADVETMPAPPKTEMKVEF